MSLCIHLIAVRCLLTGIHRAERSGIFQLLIVPLSVAVSFPNPHRRVRIEVIPLPAKEKTINSSYGSMRIEVPQDRRSTFDPKVVKKRQKDISDIDQKIISMYAKGMTTRQISETMQDIYGFETSEGFISDVTDKILPQIEDWQNRPLSEVYPVLYIDAIHYSVRDNGIIRKLAAYVILGINLEGKKEVLTIEVGENESAKYWLAVLNSLKNCGVKDILIICADGLTGIREAITTAYPETEYQRCIVHQVRNTLKYVSDKDRKAFANDLKTIYNAPNEEQGRQNRDRVSGKWSHRYCEYHGKSEAISPCAVCRRLSFIQSLDQKTVSAELLGEIAKEVKQYPLTQFYTCHCTGTEAFDFLAQQMPNMSYLSCGETVEL